MEAAKQATERRRVIKPTAERGSSRDLDQEQPGLAQQPAGERSIADLPSGPGATAMRQKAVIQMQQTHGNAYVMRQLQPSIQRQEEDATAEAAPAAAPAGQSSISGPGGEVDTGGGGVEITGGNVKVHSGMVEVDGVLKTDTIIADNVVGSNYTPGAGNIW